jgi:two-component system response regulator HydG
VSPAASRKLFSYDWPGNVRQLRNAVETMVVLDIDGLLDVDDLPPELIDVAESAPAPAGDDLALSSVAAATTTSNDPHHLVGQSMEAFERYAIEQTLQLTNGNREEAARILDIGARTLYRKLDKFKLDGE